MAQPLSLPKFIQTYFLYIQNETFAQSAKIRQIWSPCYVRVALKPTPGAIGNLGQNLDQAIPRHI
jgi:hypothetical protein